MGQNEFDNYLSSGFEKANASGLEKRFKDLEVNYCELLPSRRNASILDIGCGMGQFITYLRKNGYTDVAGIEIGREAVDYCGRHGIENVSKVDNLNDFLSRNQRKFDLVILKSVIAHLAHDEITGVLSGIRNCLKENGRLIIETFNASAWTGVFMRYNDFTHRNAFTENSLRQVLLSAGFTQIEIRPNSYAVGKPSQFMAFLIRKAWQAVLRCIYIAERGIGSNPRILSKFLIAIAEK